jgi:hypothetical protein
MSLDCTATLQQMDPLELESGVVRVLLEVSRRTTEQVLSEVPTSTPRISSTANSSSQTVQRLQHPSK